MIDQGIKFKKNKCQILHVEQGNTRHSSKVGEEWEESSPAERDLRMLVRSRLTRSQHCALGDERAKHTLGGIKHSKTTSPKRLLLLKCQLNDL